MLYHVVLSRVVLGRNCLVFTKRDLKSQVQTQCLCDFSDYQGADDNNYEAIPNRQGSFLSRKYEVPDGVPPAPGLRHPGALTLALPGTLPGYPRGDLPSPPRGRAVSEPELPPKKKPVHFIRDPNFLAKVTTLPFSNCKPIKFMGYL